MVSCVKNPYSFCLYTDRDFAPSDLRTLKTVVLGHVHGWLACFFNRFKKQHAPCFQFVIMRIYFPQKFRKIFNKFIIVVKQPALTPNLREIM